VSLSASLNTGLPSQAAATSGSDVKRPTSSFAPFGITVFG
jgi:hypothetical protein